MGTIGLARAPALPQQELAQAKHNDVGHRFRFEITEAELMVETDAEGGGEVRGSIGVVTLKGGGKISRADTHRVMLRLHTKDMATGRLNLEVHRDQAPLWEE